VLTYASETLTLTKRYRKQLNVFERKVYRRILGPVYDNEKENLRILTNKEINSSVKNRTIIETIKLHTLRWFGHVQRMEEIRIPKRELYMNLGTRLRGRARNRWQDGMREDGRIVGGEGCQEKVHNREECKKILRTARNRRILHVPMELMNNTLICGNKMPTRCNRGFYCRSYCLLNMFRASPCPSSGAQEYYTVVAACGILCCGFFK